MGSFTWPLRLFTPQPPPTCLSGLFVHHCLLDFPGSVPWYLSLPLLLEAESPLSFKPPSWVSFESFLIISS